MSHLSPEGARLGNKEKALIKSIKAGDSKKVRALIESGADVDCGDTVGHDSNITPLMYAAEGGHREVIELLLRAKANLHTRDQSAATRGGGGTALHYASQVHSTGKPDIATLELLLTAGADPNACLANGDTALDGASSRGFLDAVELMLKHGGAPNSSLNSQGWPALMGASANGHLEVVNALIAAGAKVDGVTDQGSTPLMAAALCKRAAEHGFDGTIYDEVVRLLLKHGAEADAKDKRGRTALMRAVDEAACSNLRESFQCRFAVVRRLVETGATKVNLKDDSGKTALDYSAVCDYPELPKYLRHHGAMSGLES